MLAISGQFLPADSLAIIARLMLAMYAIAFIYITLILAAGAYSLMAQFVEHVIYPPGK